MVNDSKNWLTVFKFCPKCGGILKPRKNDGQIMPTCTDKKCGYVFWQVSAPAVTAIIRNEEGKILFTVRGIEPSKGKLDLPGGFLQRGELPEDGMVREAREELGVEIIIKNVIGFVMDDYEYQAVPMINLIIALEAEIVRGRVKASDKREITDIVWLDPNDYDPSLLALGYNQRLLELLKEQEGQV